jgi:two-component system sensor histidine kinase KdpD
MTRALADVRTERDLAKLATEHVTQEFDRPCTVLLADAQRRVVLDEVASRCSDPNTEQVAAQLAFDTLVPTGCTNASVPGAQHSYLPACGSTGAFAVLALLNADRHLEMAPEQRQLLETMAHQIGLAVERLALAAEARTATLQAEAEALKNSLLSAIAHDFRTPLASIIAASSTLMGSRGHLSDSQCVELAEAILQEGQRMARLCNNTLELARVESGAVALRREWHPVEELVGAVVTNMQDRLIDHVIQTRLPAGIPMAHVDGVLMVHVLENLVENAVKYTPKGSRIEIGAEQGEHMARFWVSDDGPGISPGEESRIFEKFYRGRAEGAQRGIGLGLAICKAVVHSHGGGIVARNQPRGGAEFSLTIPHLEPPPVFVPEE